MIPIIARSLTPKSESTVAAVCLASCPCLASRSWASRSSCFHASQSERGMRAVPVGVAEHRAVVVHSCPAASLSAFCSAWCSRRNTDERAR